MPGPDQPTLLRMLESAVRVPDHGKRTPFRFLKLEGDSRHALGALLAERSHTRDPDASDSVIEKDDALFFAPASSGRRQALAGTEKIPTGAPADRGVASASRCFRPRSDGFRRAVAERLGQLRTRRSAACWHRWDETVAGFIHIGTAQMDATGTRTPRPPRCSTNDAGMSVHETETTSTTSSTRPAAEARPDLRRSLTTPASTCFRAWPNHADEFQIPMAGPTNAVQGFARFLLDILEARAAATSCGRVRRSPGSCFRNRLYPAYKPIANAPEELKRQFAHCRALCVALGLSVLGPSRMTKQRSDRQRALLHARAQAPRHHPAADKDLSQLLPHQATNSGLRPQPALGRACVRARTAWNAHRRRYTGAQRATPRQHPRRARHRRQTAAILLAHFGDLDSLLRRVEEVPYLRFRGAAQAAAKLREHRDNALLFRTLTTIACDVPLGDVAHRFERNPCVASSLGAVCEALRFGPMTRRRLYAAGGLDFAAHAPQANEIDEAL